MIIIDADLQDPPEVIPEPVAAWHEGFDMIYARRRVREGETWLKTRTAALFYRLMRNCGRVELPPDTGDFRLMSRRAVDALLQLRERHGFMKGLLAWVGFPSKPVLYDRACVPPAKQNGTTGSSGTWRSRASPVSVCCR